MSPSLTEKLFKRRLTAPETPNLNRCVMCADTVCRTASLQGSLQKLWQKIADVSCQWNHFSIAIQLQHLQPYSYEVLADLWIFSRSSMIVRRLWQLFVGSLAMWTSQTISMKDQLGFVLSVAQILEYLLNIILHTQ